MKVFKQIIVAFLVLSCPYLCFGKSKNDKKAEVNHEHHRGAEHEGHDHSDQKASLKKISASKMVLKVKGMVCAFCAQGIEKNFNKIKSVKKTKVNLDKMEVAVTLRPGQSLDEKVIRKVIKDAGFGYEGLKK